MRSVIFCLIASLLCNLAWSQEPDWTLQQFNHRAYTAAESAPNQVNAFAQTTDGTLWVGGEIGLSRFDGFKFVRYPGPGDDPLPSTAIFALTASTDGGLWIGFVRGGVGFLKNGRITFYRPDDEVPGGVVTGFAWEQDGTLWVGTDKGLARLHGSHWEKIANDLVPAAMAVSVDRAGTVWVATYERVLIRESAKNSFREFAKVDVGTSTHPWFSTSPDGKVWLGFARDGLIRMDPPGDPRPLGNRQFRVPQAYGQLKFDREGSLWSGGLNGVRRWPRQALGSDSATGETLPQAEEFSHADGLTVGAVSAPFQDREGNIWFSTSNGLDRFSRSNVLRISIPRCLSRYAIVAGDGGTLWAACYYGESEKGFLLEIRNGLVVSKQNTDFFSAAYRDSEGTVWFAGSDMLGRLEAGHIAAMPLPEQVRGDDAQAVLRDSIGALWLSSVSKGTWRYFHGQWTQVNIDGLPPNAQPNTETLDSGGALWFGYPSGRIARLQGGTVKLFSASNGLQVGNVTAVCASGQEIWAGGELGLARLDGPRFVPVLSSSTNPLVGITGIVVAEDGDLWLNAIGGIAHIPLSEIQRVAQDPNYHVQPEVFDYLDGVPGGPAQMRPLPSAVQNSDGRIYFVMGDSLVSIDAAHLVRNPSVPPLRIWSITSEGREYINRGVDLHLPVHSANLKIDYTAGSLTIPERVRFRYKLDGLDKAWQDVGAQRQAVYTNLSPGAYVFHVIAANNDGVWNDVGSSLGFTITPAFYQTRWFYLLCALLSLAVLFALYRLRVRQLGAQIRARLEVRLAERERIARELHDTLLQAVQGLIWRFQSVTNRISEDEPARNLMEQALDRADQVLAESRYRVKDLRASRFDAADLPQMLAAEGEQLALEHPTKFRTSVEGKPRELEETVREEALFVAREALGNAFRHAGAEQIEAEVSFGEAELLVRIRDNGRGIGAEVLEAGGKSGHFGLLGMRERAKKIRAQLDIWSKPGAGTEIDLRVPADVAYRQLSSSSRRTWSWRDIFGRSEAEKAGE